MRSHNAQCGSFERLALRTAGAPITDSMQRYPHLRRLGESASGEGLGVRLQMHFSRRSAILSRFSLRLHRCQNNAKQQGDGGCTI